MGTNKSMAELLERLAELIDETNAINVVLRRHIKRQKTLGLKDTKNERYVYDIKKKVYKLVK